MRCSTAALARYEAEPVGEAPTRNRSAGAKGTKGAKGAKGTKGTKGAKIAKEGEDAKEDNDQIDTSGVKIEFKKDDKPEDANK